MTDCRCTRCRAQPSLDEVQRILAEMDRFGPNRGWVLAGVIQRARLGEQIAWPSFKTKADS